MRFFTTLVLIILSAGVLVGWKYRNSVARITGIGQTQSTAATELPEISANALVAIEIEPEVRLESQNGTTWNLADGWPARQAEVQQLIANLTSMNTRFAPIPLDDPKKFGLDPSQSPLIVKATLREGTYKLSFGSPPDVHGNPFTRPTYLRVDEGTQVIRLAPGLIAQLRKHRDDFLRRQLFPDIVRVKLPVGLSFGGETELPPPAVALLDAQQLTITGPDGTWSLRRRPEIKPFGETPSSAPVTVSSEKLANAWELSAPVMDHADPEKLRGVLAALPELWAEEFVAETDLAKTGLDNPERTVKVQTPERELTVLIGKVSRVKETKAPPPPANPMAPPPPPPQREEYRYAKLPNNPQVFEVRTDHFGDLFVKPGELRDPKIARFRSADVKQLDIAFADHKLSFAKSDDAWKITSPVAAQAESGKVAELIDRLADLQVKGEDLLDTPDLKAHGLGSDDKGGTVTLSLIEDGAPRKIEYRIGKQDTAKKKLYLQVAGSARVNAVGDDLLKLVDRPVLAYRSRRVIDVPAKQLTQITVERPADGFTLAQTDGQWSLTVPIVAKSDSNKSSSLANDLSRLEAAEFVNFAPTSDDLKNYGLYVPTLKVVMTFTDGPAKNLLLGGSREGKQEVFAKLADSPEVLSLRQQVKDAIDQPSLAFRPLQLWQTSGPAITQIAVDRAGDSFTLSRDGALWKIAGPFAANAFLPSVQPILDAAMAPRAERFEAHTDADLAKYGLDQPPMTLRVKDDTATEKTIQLGKPTGDGLRFARLPNQLGVFVLSNQVASAIDRPALDLLDRRLLDLDPRMIVRLEGTSPTGTWSAKREGDSWKVDSLTPPAAGDRTIFDSLVSVWAGLRASRFAAYGSSDLKKFGLDPPATSVTATVQAGEKTIPHTIAIGSVVEGTPTSRYVRIDGGPAIGILSNLASIELTHTALELVERNVFTFDPRELTSVRRTVGGQETLLERKNGTWQIVKPTAAPGDELALAEMAERLSALRAVKVAALGASEVKPFGLDDPAAIFEISLTEKDGKPRLLTLKLGGTSAPDGRFASASGDTVFIVPDSPSDPLATRLMADPIKFRDRAIMSFTDAERVTITRNGRVVTFVKAEGAWKMTAPITAEAESFDLDDLVMAVSRLRADELIAEKPADLKAFGLDKPEAELQFFRGDAEVAKLLVGARGSDGRAAVKSASADLVGRLDAGLSNRVLGEFRKRTFWNNLDVAQVETLIINSGAAPLVLTKNENGWQAPGKADPSVRVEAISDLLVALASLKVERFVVDYKADAKLHGLDPAQRTIVVRTRTGQTTTLSLGRFEGDSKRPYASSPDNPGVVAVLSEADGARLLRPLNEFLGKN